MNDSDHALQGVGVTLVATTGVFQSDKEIEDIWLHAAVDGTVVTIKYAYRPMR